MFVVFILMKTLLFSTLQVGSTYVINMTTRVGYLAIKAV